MAKHKRGWVGECLAKLAGVPALHEASNTISGPASSRIVSDVFAHVGEHGAAQHLATLSKPGAEASETGMAALIGLDFHYRYVSAQSVALFGATPAEMMGRNAFEHVHSDDRRLVETFIGSDDLFLGGRGGVVYRMVRPNKQIVWMQTMVRALDAADPCYTGKHVLVHREVVATQAGIVPFAILNTFDALLDRDWARALIDGAPMSVLLIDVDHFALFLAHEQVIPDTQEEPTSRTDDLFLPFPKHFAAVGTLCGCAGCRS